MNMPKIILVNPANSDTCSLPPVVVSFNRVCSVQPFRRPGSEKPFNLGSAASLIISHRRRDKIFYAIIEIVVFRCLVLLKLHQDAD